MNLNVIENQYLYQKDLNERTVALVHDVSRSSQGSLSLRAFRLSPSFMTAYKEAKFTTERFDDFYILCRGVCADMSVTAASKNRTSAIKTF